MASERAAFAILGATGLTGRAVISYLRRQIREPLDWIIAGRNEALLHELARGFAPASTPRVVPVGDLATCSLEPLTGEARWLANLAGPYASHGDRVIESCLSTGTHYLDISGEVDVIGSWINRFHSRAKSLAVQIVPAAGFESLPFDLLTRSVVERSAGPTHELPLEVDVLLSYRGLGWARFPQYASRGTVSTTLETLLRNPPAEQLLDPSSLSSDNGSVPGGSRDQLKLTAHYDEEYKVWRAPLVPGPFINPAVIHRSNALLTESGSGYGPGFSYREAMNVSSIAPWPWGQSVIANTIAASAREFLSALGSDSIRRQSALALWRNLAAQSTKLEERDLDTVDYQLDITAKRKGLPVVRARLNGSGHPGYRSTGNIIGELLLGLSNESGIPRHGGVLTPALAFGPDWLSRLENAGLQCSWYQSAP